MKAVIAFFVFILISEAALAQPKAVPVWSGVAPGSETWNWEEGTITGNDGLPRVNNVVRPTLTVYLPDPAKSTGAGWLICPGGGFRWLAMIHEGTPVAEWLNQQGIAAFILKYRLVHTTDPPAATAAVRDVIPLAVADAEQAMRVIRAHASEWGIAPDRVGVIGFSAGGQLAAALALEHDAAVRPNFAAPMYPATPDEIAPGPDAPPLFIVQADDDKTVPPDKHSVRLYLAWKSAGRPAELHIYSRGGHGFGMTNANLAAAYDAYLDAYAARRGSPPDRRYLEAHEGHMMYLKPGEDAFVQPELIPALTLTGDPEQVRERVRALVAAGVDNLAVQAIPGLARELIDEFGREDRAGMR
jgi:acetyl esterase/lipase